MRRMSGIALVLGMLAASAAVGGLATPPVSMTPPVGDARMPRASVVVADYRYGDVLWENDRIAHRIYGHALEAVEPPSSSGIDAWGKNVRWPYMDRQLRTGDQHANHGEGLDFYNVNMFRGTGGLGIWHANKLWTSRNYRAVRILQNGPERAQFEVDYAPWPVDTGRKVWETRQFTLPLGTNFTRMVSTLQSDKPDPLIVGIGITRQPTGPGAGSLTVDREEGRIIWWGPEDPVKGAMGAALLVDPAMIVGVRDDANDHLVLLRVMPGQPFVYHMGAAWSRGLDFHTAAQWAAYVRSQRPDFVAAKPIAQQTGDAGKRP